MTGTFTGCKDYDDDIDALDNRVTAVEKSVTDVENAIKNGKWVTSYNPTTNGYELILSDGSKLVITNGKNGEKGEQGIQGEKGEPGTSASAIIPKFKVDEENYWMVSVDEGKSYSYVTNEEGDKICAKGQDGEPGTSTAPSTEEIQAAIGTVMTVGEDGYMYFGNQKSGLKFDATLPIIVDNEKDGTIDITLNGETYKVLKTGSSYRGLNSIIWRRMHVDDGDEYATAPTLFQTIKVEGENTDVVVASAPAKVDFKILPTTFKTDEATFACVDFHKLTRNAEPTADKAIDVKAITLSAGVKLYAYDHDDEAVTANGVKENAVASAMT